MLPLQLKYIEANPEPPASEAETLNGGVELLVYPETPPVQELTATEEAVGAFPSNTIVKSSVTLPAFKSFKATACTYQVPLSGKFTVKCPSELKVPVAIICEAV
ncbi:MAG: hypothetical protein HZC29_00235 [Thaumarchaeota archaeon]|nr:hypothetical protein [Nitrososphaerota archaeon]